MVRLDVTEFVEETKQTKYLGVFEAENVPNKGDFFATVNPSEHTSYKILAISYPFDIRTRKLLDVSITVIKIDFLEELRKEVRNG